MKILLIIFTFQLCSANIPLVVNTWNFINATQKAWEILNISENDNALDALTLGCKVCQDEQCDNTVGYGGSPDENGETTLDALIFDGDTMDMGAVGGLRSVKNAIAVARYVLEHSEHSFLVGNLASAFAEKFGFPNESLQTNFSLNLWEEWKANNCQPNFWKNVFPDPKNHCGPYTESNILADNTLTNTVPTKFNSRNHDTIGMIVISQSGHIVAGTSTNGATYKIPGRVGDSPIPGAGAYADSNYGAAAATGDGDIMMRFLPSFLAVEQLRLGASPEKAAKISLSRIIDKYPTFFGGIIVADKKGNIGAYCNGMEQFPFSVASADYPNSVIKYVNCANVK
ncbi:N(4)-(Beta-N-acetylglucosaminyl)-L-asparaginase [Anoplophora glabripennis]|uniref:N(4)-(Beta-N-acetylglucosaminyl)-L-asparaginase n=1 Tax=Anoplophora glabripennis TaxID=217634 RepID=UPI000874A4E4|nr:N(4)-(Beta-N-acetylglucosaminyl)-L-asparaginase [Anoplophora glabripennis]